MSLWSSGGKAFSPGRLSAKIKPSINLQGFFSHADFESRCDLCHAPLETTQDKLCLACHTATAREIELGERAHGHIDNVDRCAQCHPDHRGADFDPGRAAYPYFVHSKTSFSLLKHQVSYSTGPILCEDCHNVDDHFTASDAACTTCHADHDAGFVEQHIRSHGKACLLCHDGQDRMMVFDHQLTRFPLDGRHAAVTCVDCHKIDATANDKPTDTHLSLQSPLSVPGDLATSNPAQVDPFASTPTECEQCHSEPEQHLGLFEARCAECHTTGGWLPAKLDGEQFEHTQTTGFSLAHHQKDYQDQFLTCTGCHSDDLANFDLQICANCHSQGEERAAFMQEHQAKFGPDCLQCHDGADRMSNFDHANFFPLDGKHAEVECSACHQEFKFAGTPSACVQCHAEPEIHAGFFGVQCQYCHTAAAWVPAQLRQHIFPLDHGGQGEIECQVCHPSNYAQNTCYGCHDHQPEPIAASHLKAGISMDDLPNCASCHPIGLIEPDQ